MEQERPRAEVRKVFGQKWQLSPREGFYKVPIPMFFGSMEFFINSCQQ